MRPFDRISRDFISALFEAERVVPLPADDRLSAAVDAAVTRGAPPRRRAVKNASSPSAGSQWLSSAILGMTLLSVLLLLVFIRPIDHDESQYVAATVLAADQRIYRDFDYLQTPLQPLLLAPVVATGLALPLLLLRWVNACLGALAAFLIGRTIGMLTTSRQWAWIGAGLFVATEAFQFSATAARNDMLPLLCLCVSIHLLLRLPAAPARAQFGISILAGALMAGAVGAKISYAFPAASLPIVEIVARRAQGRCLHLRGYLFGSLPVVALVATVIAAAPQHALFDILTFPSEAPTEWYQANHRAFDLSLAGRLLSFAKFFLLGSGPVLALAMVTRPESRESDALFRPAESWFRWQTWGLLGAGLIAALMPKPLWQQYLLPFYPPLFVLGVPSLEMRLTDRSWRIALISFAASGCAISSAEIWYALGSGSPVLALDRRTVALGTALSSHRIQGYVASIAPEYVAGSGDSLDVRFAAGPFLFRSRDGLGEAGAIVGATGSTAIRTLTDDPPAAIVTGGDELTSGSRKLDSEFRMAAARAGFRRVQGWPDGLELWSRAMMSARAANTGAGYR